MMITILIRTLMIMMPVLVLQDSHEMVGRELKYDYKQLMSVDI